MNTAKQLDLPEGTFNEWFDQRFDQKMFERDKNKIPSMTIIATKGTLDMAYPPSYLWFFIK